MPAVRSPGRPPTVRSIYMAKAAVWCHLRSGVCSLDTFVFWKYDVTIAEGSSSCTQWLLSSCRHVRLITDGASRLDASVVQLAMLGVMAPVAVSNPFHPHHTLPLHQPQPVCSKGAFTRVNLIDQWHWIERMNDTVCTVPPNWTRQSIKKWRQIRNI
jgi:hypothetical protein